MRKMLLLIVAFALVLSAAVAQTPSQSAASKEDVLSFDQKVKISKLVAKQTAPLTNPSFSVAIDGVVPSEIQLHPLPSDAEELAPNCISQMGRAVSDRFHKTRDVWR